MTRLQLEPKGKWGKWMPNDADVHVYSLTYTDAAGKVMIQNWTHTPNMTPDDIMVKAKLVELEQRIEDEGGSYEHL